MNLTYLRACARVVSADDSRQGLQYVRVEFHADQTFYIATNGHVLLWLREEISQESRPALHFAAKDLLKLKGIFGFEDDRIIGGNVFAAGIRDVSYPADALRRIVAQCRYNGKPAAFAFDVMQVFCAAAKELDLKSTGYALLHHDNGPCLATFNAGFAVLMPFRNKDTAELPSWFPIPSCPTRMP